MIETYRLHYLPMMGSYHGQILIEMETDSFQHTFTTFVWWKLLGPTFLGSSTVRSVGVGVTLNLFFVFRWNYKRMWDTFYWHSAYNQITFVTCQESAQNLTFTQQMVHYRIGTFGPNPEPFRQSGFTIDPYGQKIQMHISHDSHTSKKIIFS